MERGPRELVADVERVLEEIETIPDVRARERTLAAVQAVVELYGTGLERIVDEIAARDDGELAGALADDELVAHLLLLHGLHPVPLADRVVGALDEVRPYLESHGGNVELRQIEDTAVHLRLEGSCSGCPSSTMTLKLAIENAIRKAAPEIEQVVADQGAAASSSDLLQIEVAPAVSSDGSWTVVGALRELASGGLIVKQVAGEPVLFLALDERFYAYRPRCPACAESLAGATLDGFELSCAECGNRFDALRAGRCLDSPQLHLDPIPLLVSKDGLVKVALPVAA